MCASTLIDLKDPQGILFGGESQVVGQQVSCSPFHSVMCACRAVRKDAQQSAEVIASGLWNFYELFLLYSFLITGLTTLCDSIH